MLLQPKHHLTPMNFSSLKQTSSVILKTYYFLNYASFNSQEKGLISYLGGGWYGTSLLRGCRCLVLIVAEISEVLRNIVGP